MELESTGDVGVVTGAVGPEGLGLGSVVWGSPTFGACVVTMVPGMSVVRSAFSTVGAPTVWLVSY